jgi:hypothetical protein
MTDEQETVSPEAMNEEDRAAYEAYQAQLQANRERREEAERQRVQAVILEAAKQSASADDARIAASLVNRWEIDSQELPAILTQYGADTEPLARLVLNQGNLEGLLHELNRLYIAPEETPLTWAVRYPDYSDIPVLTLFRGPQPIGSLPLDEELGKPLSGILAKLYPTKPRTPRWQLFKGWVRHHPIYTGLIALVILPFVAITLFGTIVNLLAYIQ